MHTNMPMHVVHDDYLNGVAAGHDRVSKSEFLLFFQRRSVFVAKTFEASLPSKQSALKREKLPHCSYIATAQGFSDVSGEGALLNTRGAMSPAAASDAYVANLSAKLWLLRTSACSCCQIRSGCDQSMQCCRPSLQSTVLPAWNRQLDLKHIQAQ